MATDRDLLKEAIADAKAVKEATIANAKVALEEAFTPFLKEKLALTLSKSEKKLKKKVNYFIQVNIANEPQKGGIQEKDLNSFCNFCKHDLDLNIIGLMIIPPANQDSRDYFQKLKDLAINNELLDLSMGMSNDYMDALKSGSTFIRIGSLIFKS